MFTSLFLIHALHRCPTLTARTCRSSNAQRCPHQQQCLIWIWIYQLNIFCDWIMYIFQSNIDNIFVFPGSWTTVPTGALHRVTAGLLRLSLNLNLPDHRLYFCRHLYLQFIHVPKCHYPFTIHFYPRQPTYVPGLRRHPPQDPSKSEPDSAKEDVRRCVRAFFLFFLFCPRIIRMELIIV